MSIKFEHSLKSDKNKKCFTQRPIYFWSYIAEFSLEWEIFQAKIVQKIKTHFMLDNFFPKLVPFMR
jgi:hypothetical protein